MSSPRQIFNIVVSILPGSLPDKTVLSVDVEKSSNFIEFF